jgi:hypothetical protein
MYSVVICKNAVFGHATTYWCTATMPIHFSSNDWKEQQFLLRYLR